MTLSDQQLEQLLRLARQADEAAHAWHGAPAHHGGGHLRLADADPIPHGSTALPVVAFWRRARILAAAAGLALAGGLAWWAAAPRSSPADASHLAANPGRATDVAHPGAGSPLASTDHPDGPLVDDPSDAPIPSNAVVLAIVPDERGELRCVRWAAAPLQGTGGPGLAGVHPDELRALGLGMLCEETAPRVLVVGLEGPPGSLPACDSHAADLARCILKSPGGKLPGSSELCTPGTCMPTSVRMRMEAVAVR